MLYFRQISFRQLLRTVNKMSRSQIPREIPEAHSRKWAWPSSCEKNEMYTPLSQVGFIIGWPEKYSIKSVLKMDRKESVKGRKVDKRHLARCQKHPKFRRRWSHRVQLNSMIAHSAFEEFFFFFLVQGRIPISWRRRTGESEGSLDEEKERIGGGICTLRRPAID